MTSRIARRVFALTTAGLLVGAFIPENANAWPFYLTQFEMAYPASLTSFNANGNSACLVCHSDSNGGDGWNDYGWDVNTRFQVHFDIDLAIMEAEVFDSDSDLTASDNLVEITASAQPGWTPGPVNTHHFVDGSTVQNQMPPSGILGSLDPGPGGGLGSNYCTASPNSVSAAGAPMSATGSASIAANDLVLAAGPIPAGEFGVFYHGNNAGMAPFGDGIRCVNGQTVRLWPPSAADAGGTITRAVDNTAASAAGIVSGGSRRFQCWYRDPSGGPNGFNLSDGLLINFTP